MEYKVNVAEAGSRLDAFLGRQLTDMGKRHIRQIISAGNVKVNNRLISKPGFLLFCDSIVEIEDRVIQDPPVRSEIGKDQTLEILYEDEHLLILNKPRVMHSVRLHREESISLADIIVAKYPESIKVTADPREGGLAQRLDFYTCGALIAAKSNAVWEKIHFMLQCEEIKKSYYALCEGKIPDRINSIQEPILQQKSAKKVKISSDGVTAKTKILKKKPFTLANEALTLVEVAVNRARRHQIRAHLAYISHPLVGDVLYGARKNLANLALNQSGFIDEGFYLHAYKIAFNHPIDNERISVVARDNMLDFFKQEAEWEN